MKTTPQAAAPAPAPAPAAPAPAPAAEVAMSPEQALNNAYNEAVTGMGTARTERFKVSRLTDEGLDLDFIKKLKADSKCVLEILHDSEADDMDLILRLNNIYKEYGLENPVHVKVRRGSQKLSLADAKNAEFKIFRELHEQDARCNYTEQAFVSVKAEKLTIDYVDSNVPDPFPDRSAVQVISGAVTEVYQEESLSNNKMRILMGGVNATWTVDQFFDGVASFTNFMKEMKDYILNEVTKHYTEEQRTEMGKFLEDIEKLPVKDALKQFRGIRYKLKETESSEKYQGIDAAITKLQGFVRSETDLTYRAFFGQGQMIYAQGFDCFGSANKVSPGSFKNLHRLSSHIKGSQEYRQMMAYASLSNEKIRASQGGWMAEEICKKLCSPESLKGRTAGLACTQNAEFMVLVPNASIYDDEEAIQRKLLTAITTPVNTAEEIETRLKMVAAVAESVNLEVNIQRSLNICKGVLFDGQRIFGDQLLGELFKNPRNGLGKYVARMRYIGLKPDKRGELYPDFELAEDGNVYSIILDKSLIENPEKEHLEKLTPTQMEAYREGGAESLPESYLSKIEGIRLDMANFVEVSHMSSLLFDTDHGATEMERNLYFEGDSGEELVKLVRTVQEKGRFSFDELPQVQKLLADPNYKLAVALSDSKKLKAQIEQLEAQVEEGKAAAKRAAAEAEVEICNLKDQLCGENAAKHQPKKARSDSAPPSIFALIGAAPHAAMEVVDGGGPSAAPAAE